MAKVKVEVVNAIVSGKVHGETLFVEKEEAEKLESIDYVKVLAAAKETKAKGKE